MLKWLGLMVCASIYLVSMQLQACELKMGYRTTARMPNINAKPNNTGLYYDLYKAAADKIGCELVVVRSPKNRILRGLKDGSIDFYPGLTFTEARSEFYFFYPNGIPAADVGLTRIGKDKIKNYDQLAHKVVLVALGSPGPQTDNPHIDFKRPPELTFERAIDLILANQADFYMDDFGTLYYYLVQHPRQTELMFHMNCCGGMTQLTLGFSKQSPHFASETNPHYDASKPLYWQNYPTQTVSGTVADKFRLALKELADSGFTNTLYKDYYGASLADLMAAD
ncbi:substrate-binding periplasmic protein [Motilimonas eburnea]|uniref:substrate-binding periplasmic protein n=1 Tax=Motilimonas eburnea TaxID=1737488 RepID=UPI001E5F4AD3|nr:transporter substrate-binding domain-containing protein [Motilimonas eburnea]MCE2571224.1 transporter substrate-binding domain-containing protein [Motilimonas eburnea]